MNKLLIRTSSLEGESLTSYIQKICQLNAISPHSFWRLISLQNAHYPQSDMSSLLNIVPHSIIDLDLMATLLDLSVKKLEELTLVPVLRKWYGNETESKEMASQRLLSNMVEPNLKFCPLCIAEEPGYKLIWQVNEINICQKHSVELLNQCPSCLKKIPCLAPNSKFGYCPQCGNNLNHITPPRVNIENNAREYSDWEYLMDPLRKPFANSQCVDKREQIALKVLFVTSNQEEFFSREIAYKSLSPSTISALLQTARGSSTYHRFVHLSIILSVIRYSNISMEYFSELEIPETFSKSILDPSPLMKDQYYCMAPWCKSYDTPGSLKRTPSSKKVLKSGTTFNYYMYCDSCGIRYAIDSSTLEIAERGHFIELGWKKVRVLALKKASIRSISRSLKEPIDTIVRCIIYLISNNLLPNDLYKWDIPANPDSAIISEYLKSIKNNTPIKRIRKMLNLSYVHSLYYWFLPQVQIAFSAPSGKPRTKPSTPEWVEQLNPLLEELELSNQIITIKIVSQRLGVCPETLRLNGLLPIIKNAKQQQDEDIKRKKSIALMEMADRIIEGMIRSGEPLKSDAIYEKLGTSRRVLVRSFPEVTRYINQYIKYHK